MHINNTENKTDLDTENVIQYIKDTKNASCEMSISET